jgi:prepilin-type N-terminal cleavage/methylation domain-containing protein
VVTIRAPGRRGERGFTVAEVLIALAIAAIGLAAMLAIHSTGSNATQYSRHATEATVLAEQALEELLTVPANDVVSGGDVVNAQGLDDSQGAYAREWTVAWTGDLAAISVEVTWLDDDGAHTIAVGTRRAR